MKRGTPTAIGLAAPVLALACGCFPSPVYYALVNITSEPAGARVRIGGKKRMLGPWRGHTPVGGIEVAWRPGSQNQITIDHPDCYRFATFIRREGGGLRGPREPVANQHFVLTPRPGARELTELASRLPDDYWQIGARLKREQNPQRKLDLLEAALLKFAGTPYERRIQAATYRALKLLVSSACKVDGQAKCDALERALPGLAGTRYGRKVESLLRRRRGTAAATDSKSQMVRYKFLMLSCAGDRTRKLEMLEAALPEFAGTKFEMKVRQMIEAERRRRLRRRTRRSM